MIFVAESQFVQKVGVPARLGGPGPLISRAVARGRTGTTRPFWMKVLIFCGPVDDDGTFGAGIAVAVREMIGLRQEGAER